MLGTSALNTAAKPQWPTTALAFLLCLSVIVLTPLGVYNVQQRSDWAVGDWLINYSGGFVRRGLTGSFALAATSLHVPPTVVILCLQLSLYVVVFTAVWVLLRKVRWTVPLLALVFSPATLQFPLMDPNFAFRKEILFFALLSTVLWQLRTHVSAIVIIPTLFFGCALCVLSHEALLVFFPYLFGALWLGLPRSQRPLAWAILPAVTAGILFLAVSTHPGTAATAKAVCSSLGGTISDPPSGLCGGAIAYLSRSSFEARGDVRRVAIAEHYRRIMPVLILLSLLPVALQLRTLWLTGQRRQVRIIASSALPSMAASIGLFLYGTDWTRWIYIHSFSLMLLLIFTAPSVVSSNSPSTVPSHDATELPRQGHGSWALLAGNGPTRFVLAACLLLYVFAWHLSLYQPRIPFGGLIHYLHKTHPV